MFHMLYRFHRLYRLKVLHRLHRLHSLNGLHRLQRFQKFQKIQKIVKISKLQKIIKILKILKFQKFPRLNRFCRFCRFYRLHWLYRSHRINVRKQLCQASRSHVTLSEKCYFFHWIFACAVFFVNLFFLLPNPIIMVYQASEISSSLFNRLTTCAHFPPINFWCAGGLDPEIYIFDRYTKKIFAVMSNPIPCMFLSLSQIWQKLNNKQGNAVNWN